MTTKKIIEKINNLFALAGNNPNTNEAMNAMAKARALMLEYEISEKELGHEPAEDLGYVEVEYNSSPFAKVIFSAIAKLNMCGYARGPKTGGNKMSHVIYGTPHRREVAASVGLWVAKTVYSAGLREKKLPQSNKHTLTSFTRGAADMIYRRAMELIEEQRMGEVVGTGGETLPAVIDYDQQMQVVRRFMDQSGVTTKRSRKPMPVDLGAYMAGSDFGKKINLGAQVRGGQKNDDKQIASS